MTHPLIHTLRERFEKNMHRHPDILWSAVESRLIGSPHITSLEQMESTGGEPDVVGIAPNGQNYIWMDSARESPIGRRSLCYDRRALDGRKENKPKNNVEDMAREMGIELLDEVDYRYLQSLEPIDLKTSSWIKTPDGIRDLGGAIFCDRRYETVFTYHNGADSYYAARGWRGKIHI